MNEGRDSIESTLASRCVVCGFWGHVLVGVIVFVLVAAIERL